MITVDESHKHKLLLYLQKQHGVASFVWCRVQRECIDTVRISFRERLEKIGI